MVKTCGIPYDLSMKQPETLTRLILLARLEMTYVCFDSNTSQTTKRHMPGRRKPPYLVKPLNNPPNI